MDSTHPLAVLSKLNEQRSQGLFCDVTIVVEDVKFRAHKNILAACSRYFRNALTTSDSWTSGQVLELLDLKSEVFANILNFIYCSKVASDGAEDRRGLSAAGKRLGIPFLEMLAEEEKQDDCVKSTNMFKKRKQDFIRAEEGDSSRGPRITNAFSITEVCPTNNPFTPLVEASSDRQSPDLTQLPTSSTSCPNGTGETTHTLSEHSYAVNKSTEGTESSQPDGKKASVMQPKHLIYKNAGPLKKRHRLRGVLGKSTFPAEAEVETPNTITPVLTDSAATVPVLTPPPLYSEAEAEEQMNSGAPAAADSPRKELSPPPLSPHTEDSILIYSCERCPEIFSNKALLILHSEVHKKRFVSHLFCKFCHRKFIHLKRLRNHEQVCPKAARDPSKREVREISEETDRLPDDAETEEEEDVVTPLSPAGLSNPHTPESIQMYQTHGEKAVKPSSSQRKYNCSVCKRVYVTLSSLKRHENVHSWRRAYPCHYCNKVFALAEYRTKHEIWHTGERRYQCIFCLETFMTYYILKNHQKSFHGIDPSLAVKKKSANGGLKGSVYPIKLYRLLPMKFRKRQYKTYSQTYSESLEGSDPSSLSSSSLISPFDDNGTVGLPDTGSIPLTFMATTKMVSPVMPRICFNKPLDADQSLNIDLESGPRNEESRDKPFQSRNSTFSVEPNSNFATDYTGDSQMASNPESINNSVSFLSSMSTVKKLGELSASAKRVEDMTKEILQSSAENRFGAKTETYIAKPACQGTSVDSNTLPLCQITVKIGNEAIIRRQIKGSKLFPRKKRRIRDPSGGQSLNRCPLRREKSESARLRLRTDGSATAPNVYEDINDCDTADELWRPYYSYKAKKKIKKLRYKHRKALFHLYPESSVDRTAVSEAHLDRTSTGPKQNLSTNSSPRATYTCDVCDSSFITETGLKAHVIGSHPYFCKTCGKQGPPGEAPAAADYICNSCMEDGSCFGNTPRSPNPEKKYRCSFCPQRFLYLATKRSHEKKHQETNEAYGFNACTPFSKFSAHEGEESEQDAIKTEDCDNQGGNEIKSESMEGENFSSSKSTPKREDSTDLSPSTPYQDVSYPGIRKSASPYPDSMFSLTSTKVKHKVAKKWIDEQHSVHLVSKRQASDRDGQTNNNLPVRPRKNSHGDHDKSNKMLRMCDAEATPAALLKSDKWVCKEEPLF